MLKPYPYQQEIIDRFQFQPFMALLCEAGTGKTLIAINFLRDKFNQEKRILRTIIFCPIIVLENWRREILLCSKIADSSIGVVMGSKAKRLKAIKDPKNKILIINYEATRSEEIFSALLDFNAEVVVCDESHKIKNSKLKTAAKKNSTTGAVVKIAKSAKHRVIMSGTPSPSPEDIWAQYYFLDGGLVFGDKFYSFKNKYFVNQNANWSSDKAYPDWRFIKSKEPEYKQKLATYAVAMKKEECVDLPDLTEQVISVEPTTEMLKHYKEVERDLITWIDSQADNPLAVKNALTKVLRLAEILSGYLRLEDDTIHKLKTNPTLEALLEILEATGEAKVIVFCNFKQNYIDISKALEKKKIEFVEIHGGVSTKQKLENVDIFNDMTNNVRVCIANPQSGGVGINLKAASYTVYYSLGYSLVDFEQSRARNYRSGSIDLHKKITHYFLAHQGLITQKILMSVRDKKSLADNLLDLKKQLRERK